jgi:type II secretory pathway pseudopilin PulG
MNLFRRQLTAVKRAAQKGFTLIELAIVGLFLGLLAIFAVSQFSGSATDTTKANGLFEASIKIADNWALVAQSCGISNDITLTNMVTGVTGTTLPATAAANLDMILGVANANSAYTSCVNSSGIRPLTSVATGTAGAEVIQGYKVTAATNLTLFPGRNTMMLTFGSAAKYVPDTLVLPLYNKYSSATGASTASTVPATADTADSAIQFGATAARTLTLVKSL